MLFRHYECQFKVFFNVDDILYVFHMHDCLNNNNTCNYIRERVSIGQVHVW